MVLKPVVNQLCLAVKPMGVRQYMEMFWAGGMIDQVHATKVYLLLRRIENKSGGYKDTISIRLN